MAFIKRIFAPKQENNVKTYADFWQWFIPNEKEFHKIVKDRHRIVPGFFDKISQQASGINDGILFLTGMPDEETVELVFTADGNVKNIAFAEEFVKHAPAIKGWKFTALKPAMDFERMGIEMEGIKFDKDTIVFESKIDPAYPDEICIKFYHRQYDKRMHKVFANGIFIYLDNFLGELNFVSQVDHVEIAEELPKNDENLVPVFKLKEFLMWREKEFTEKYTGVRYSSEKDKYSVMEAQLPNGNPLIAVVNADLLKWNSKASHPWIFVIEAGYDDREHNGFPGNESMDALNSFEDRLSSQLKDNDGYLYIGRQTAENVREIYFACRDFRKPSLIAKECIGEFNHRFTFSYDIYRDKYWKTFERFEQW